jgi:hypothetical protein
VKIAETASRKIHKGPKNPIRFERLATPLSMPNIYQDGFFWIKKSNFK